MAGTAREALAAERSAPFRWMVRAGFLARAVTYGVIGILTLAIALGAGNAGASPSQQGALALIDRAPLGSAALIAIAAGLLAYAVWKLSQAAFGRGPEGGGDAEVKNRVSEALGGVVYIGFFLVALHVLIDGRAGGSSSPRGVLGWSGGPILVGLGGGALLAVSAYQCYDAVTGGFAKQSKLGEMGRDERRTFMLLGRVGLTARALVFALVGYFLVRAAIDFSPANAVGLDGALEHLHKTAYGPWLVGLAAAGLIVFATYSFFEARYRRL